MGRNDIVHHPKETNDGLRRTHGLKQIVDREIKKSNDLFKELNPTFFVSYEVWTCI